MMYKSLIHTGRAMRSDALKSTSKNRRNGPTRDCYDEESLATYRFLLDITLRALLCTLKSDA